MSENIIIAVLGVIASMFGSASLINWRLKELEKKVDNHNSYAQKFSEVSTDIAIIHKDIEYIKEMVINVRNN